MSESRSPADEPLPWRRSLRTKALVAVLALLAYVAAGALDLALGRRALFDSMQALEGLTRHERALALTEQAVAGALVEVREVGIRQPVAGVPPADLVRLLDNCEREFTPLSAFDPAYTLQQRAVQRRAVALLEQPGDDTWQDLRDTLVRVRDDLEIRHAQVINRRAAVTQDYDRQYDAVSVEALLLALCGVLAFGALAAWFFARLTQDIRRLEQHARLVVHGSRGVVLPVQRRDELGHLMHAVNQLAVDLDTHEKQIALGAERRSHQDKMLALGALAAGVAHEVNNPLAIIAGVAQEWRQPDPARSAAELAEGAQLILAQTTRAAQAARHLAEAAAPVAAEMDWVDLNALMGRMAQLAGYDKRWRRLQFHTAFDPALPAVRTTADAIQQVLMLLLSAGCDALAARPGSGHPVNLSTAQDGPMVEMRLDFPRVLDFNRGEVQRALLLARAIVEPLKGRLAVGQASLDDQRLRISLPADAGGDEG